MENENTEIQTNPPEKKVDKALLGTKIAAIVLIINAILLMIERFILPGDTAGVQSIVSIIIDFVLGILLLLHIKNIKAWVLARVILGLLIFSINHIINQEYLYLVIQVLFSLSLIGLLTGEPTLARITIISLLLTVYFLLCINGILNLTTGFNIFNATTSNNFYQLEDVTGKTCAGLNYNYSITLPNDKWKRRNNEAVKNEYEAVDRWLVLPGADAHVLIIGEDIDESIGMTLEVLEMAVLSFAKARMENFEIIKKEEIEVNSLKCRLVRTMVEISGIPLAYIYALFIKDNQIFQIVSSTGQSTMPEVEEDFMQIIYSFRLK